jgi:hypothetical protein
MEGIPEPARLAPQASQTNSEPSAAVRSRLARVALAAWVNVDPDQLPADKIWIEHPNDHNRQAWDRVVAAVIAAHATPLPEPPK